MDESTEIQNLIDALKFYALGKHYSEGFSGTEPFGPSVFNTVADKGEVATKALDQYYESLERKNKL